MRILVTMIFCHIEQFWQKIKNDEQLSDWSELNHHFKEFTQQFPHAEPTLYAFKNFLRIRYDTNLSMHELLHEGGKSFWLEVLLPECDDNISHQHAQTINFFLEEISREKGFWGKKDIREGQTLKFD